MLNVDVVYCDRAGLTFHVEHLFRHLSRARRTWPTLRALDACPTTPVGCSQMSLALSRENSSPSFSMPRRVQSVTSYPNSSMLMRYPQENQPVLPRRVKSSRRRGRDSERNMSEDEARCRSRIHRERERPFKPGPTRPKPRSKSTDSTRKCRHNHLQPTYIDDDDRGRAVSRIFWRC